MAQVKTSALLKKQLCTFGVVAILMSSGCVTNQYPYAEVGRVNERIIGIGYAVINAQPGDSQEQKRLMAIKASKLEAYKSIAEQLYGQYIESRGRLTNSRLEQEELVTRVEGLVLGARLVSIKPISEDSYETRLEIGRSDLFARIDSAEADADAGLETESKMSLSSTSTFHPVKAGSRR
ncbi:MAG: hypothetical protein CMP95_09420 [Gammaproteobacteria bacterium]|uniref:Flagellar biosynthesis protein FlgP n=1 Tax=OM182 bacterium TaxID=2510334 RepID=A0A520S0Z8_9GAMM|nr:hypothetical protein [Gammaproteobacteria bacterium]OUV67438.1 MAG: hypothetical protein CBC93_05290 [Gammaproteobacteria bacterium TMED133]RZO76140.1 MAG: hypothetical protein EVA68_05175 [OM182 bacterium]